MVGLGDRVRETVDPLGAVAHGVPDEGLGRVGVGEAGLRGRGAQLAVEQVGGLVEPGLLRRREPGEGVAVLAVEDPRVAGDDDLGGRRLGPDLGVQRGDGRRQRAVDVGLRLVDRAVAVARPGRLRAGGEHVGEPGVVAADRDRHVGRARGQGAELGARHVGDLGAGAGPEVQGVAARGGDQARVGVDRPLARAAVGEVGAGADTAAVGVTQGDVRRSGRVGHRQPAGEGCEQGQGGSHRPRDELVHGGAFPESAT